MTTAGWIVMLVSLGIVWSAVIWCYRTLLKAPGRKEVPPGFGP